VLTAGSLLLFKVMNNCKTHAAVRCEPFRTSHWCRSCQLQTCCCKSDSCYLAKLRAARQTKHSLTPRPSRKYFVYGTGAVAWGTALQAGRSRVRFPMVSLGFFIDIILIRSHYGLGVDSASNRNEYQEYFFGGKGGRCVGVTTLPPSCADCLEIWEPQPPGTLKGLSRPVMGLLYCLDRAWGPLRFLSSG
jgi:hypothetical protein